MYIFAKFLVDHIILQNRDKKYKKIRVRVHDAGGRENPAAPRCFRPAAQRNAKDEGGSTRAEKSWELLHETNQTVAEPARVGHRIISRTRDGDWSER
jgi:hypothetical protein